MNWMEIEIKGVDSLLEEVICAILFELGAAGVYVDLERCFVKGYLPEELVDASVKKRLRTSLKKIKEIFSLSQDLSFYVRAAPQIDWVREWKKFFKPIRVTELLTVIPPWEPEEKVSTRYVIKIDPGPAFGTAHHPTTQLCLKILECFKAKESLLDIGTGTGILAIYAAILGIKRILAIDIDPVALKWARHNVDLNKVSDRVALSSQQVSNICEKFSVIVANLLFNELKEVIPHVPSILEESFVISGILRDQVQELKGILEERGLIVKDVFFQQEWAAVICKKR